LLNGAVDRGRYQSSALTEGQRDAGQLLLCCATALSDLEVECEARSAAGTGLRSYTATVETLERLAPDVMLLALRLPAGEQIEFQAGQYLNFILQDGARRSYSFTTAPRPTDRIELHVRRVPGGRFTTAVFERLQPGDRLRFEGPLGRFVLREPCERPIIFIAGATGFAPVKSLLEHAFATGIAQPLYLYWGVRRRHDLYMAELAERWQREHANFHFVPVLSEPAPEDQWEGRTGLVHQALLEDFPDLSGYAVYACGSLQMVSTAQPAFLAHGLDQQYCYSDALGPGGVPSSGWSPPSG
jgi:NAD(P)H-flavin reductase